MIREQKKQMWERPNEKAQETHSTAETHIQKTHKNKTRNHSIFLI